MRMCQPHWDTLRAAIDERGLSQLVAADGEAAARRVQRELEGVDGPDDFDPLMSSMFAIFSNSLDVVASAGANVQASEQEVAAAVLAFNQAEHCPLCELNRLHERDCSQAGCTFTYDDWIDRAADDAKAHAEATVLGGGA